MRTKRPALVQGQEYLGFSTPSGWKSTTLGELASKGTSFIQTGPFGSQLHKHDYQEVGVGTVNPTHLENQRVNHTNVPRLSEETAKRLARHRLLPGDILFARRGQIGRHGLVSKAEEGWLCGTGCFLVRIQREDIDNIFLSYFVSMPEIVDWLERHAAGVVMPNLNNTVLQQLPLKYPPIREQRKIATVLALVQRAIEHEERLLELAGELKKSLMQKFFTEGLRGEPQKETEIGIVPQSWELVRCDELCHTVTVGVVVKPASHYVDKGVPAFRSMNVREDRLEVDDLVYFSEEANRTTLGKSRLRVGDVLIVRTGYPGTSCVVPPMYDGANCIDIVIARPNAEKVRSGFLSRFFNSPAGKGQALAAKHGLAQQHLNVAAVKRTLVPLPSLEEQDEIDQTLGVVQTRAELATKRRQALVNLFGTLLHQLMTAEICVNNLDLSEVEKLAA